MRNLILRLNDKNKVSNAKEVVTENRKEKSTEKIDDAVSTIMGLDRAICCGVNTGASVYDERGILFI